MSENPITSLGSVIEPERLVSFFRSGGKQGIRMPERPAEADSPQAAPAGSVGCERPSEHAAVQAGHNRPLSRFAPLTSVQDGVPEHAGAGGSFPKTAREAPQRNGG